MRVFKMSVFILCLIPVSLLIYKLYFDELGANPFEALTRQSGEWTLRFLLITLSLTPLKILLKKSWPLKFRRMLGLFVFFYASIHLMTYIWFDQFFDWPEIWIDIVKRPFITMGMLSWFILLPLALTSTNSMKKRVGRYWKKLHRFVYLIGLLVLLHYFMLVKADYWWPVLYSLFFVFLMLVRVLHSQRGRKFILRFNNESSRKAPVIES